MYGDKWFVVHDARTNFSFNYAFIQILMFGNVYVYT